MHLVFVRHGQDEDNANQVLNGHRDRPLTSLGRRQSVATARRLAIMAPDIVYCSPLARARETAAILTSQLGLPKPIALDGLIERDFGVLTGAPYTDIPRLSKRLAVYHGFQVFLEAEGVERHAQVADRFQEEMIKLAANHHSERVLLVSHGDVFKAALMALEGLSLDQSLSAPWLENAEIADLGFHDE